MRRLGGHSEARLQTTALLLSSLLAYFVSAQCSVPDPRPFGLLLRQDFSIANCLAPEFRQQPPNLVQSVRQWLPERSHPLPALLSTSHNPNLVFTSPSTIYLTFVDEGAGYRNSLGYFVYDANNRVISRNVVFPDASSSPATVRTGDTVRVGPFATGTRVGFFLIGNGFNNRFWQTNLATETYWTIDSLNHDKHRHFAMFTESSTGKVMIGIEDLYNLGDRDYNDAVFFVDVDGSINNNQFPTMLLVTTPMNTDARITLLLEAGKANRILILSLPSRGSLFQVNPDGSRGSVVTAVNTAVTNGDLLLIYSPVRDTSGSPYVTFSVTQELPNGQVIFVTVRVDVLSFAPYAPVPISKTVGAQAGINLLIQLEATDAQNLNVLATISTVPVNGALFQFNSGSTGAQITAGSRLSDPANRLYYRSNNQYILNPISDSFRFRMTNNLLMSGDATISINVGLRPNTAPVSQNIVVTFNEDTTATVDIFVTDAQGDPISVYLLDLPSNGRFFLAPDGVSLGAQITSSSTALSRLSDRFRAFFVPNLDLFASPFATVRFQAADYASRSNQHTITLNVNPVNDPPIAVGTSITMNEDSSLVAMSQRIWAANPNPDVDNTQSQLSIVITSYPEKGTLFNGARVAIARNSIPFTVSFGTEFFFQPTPLEDGTPYTSFSYQLSDPLNARSQTVIYTVNVNPINHAPVAIVPVSVNTNLNVAANILVNGQDVDRIDTLQFRVTHLPTRIGATLRMGTTSITLNMLYPLPSTGATLTYTPAANEFYADSIIVEVVDNGSPVLRDSKTIAINVAYVNIPPVANALSVTTNEGTSMTIPFSGSDANLPAEPLRYVIRTLPGRGYLMQGNTRISSVPFTVSGSTAVTFTNDPYSFGAPYTSFTYVANDGKADSAAAPVTINVNHVNHAPTAAVSSNPVRTPRYTTGSFIITTADPDRQSNDQVRVRFTLPSGFKGTLRHGTTTVTNGYMTPFVAPGAVELSYVPPAEVAGQNADYGANFASFSFVVLDNFTPSASSTSTTVSINVDFVARTPVLTSSPASLSVPERDSVVATISTRDEDNRALTVTLKSVPTGGRLHLADASGNPSGSALTAGAVIGQGTGSISGVRVVYVSPQPSSLTVSPGASSDQYVLSSSNGAKSVDTTVNVQVTDKNFAPFVSATANTINVQQSQEVQSVVFTVSGIDPDGNAMTALVTSMTLGGGVSASNDGQAITLNQNLIPQSGTSSWLLSVSVPALTRGTVASIDVVLSDGTLGSSTLTLTLAVTGVNFAPVATTTSTPLCYEDSFVDVTLSGRDDNDDSLVAFITQLPTVGAFTFNGAAVTTSTSIPLTSGVAVVRYTPPVLTYGTPVSTFRYAVSDGRLQSNEATLSLNVEHVNHAPVAIVPASVSTNLNVAANILVNGQDVDRIDTLHFLVTQLPTRSGATLRMGTTTISLNTLYPLPSTGATLTYTPAANEFYADSIIVEIFDDGSPVLSDSKTIAINVAYVNIPPVANALSVTTDEDTSVTIPFSGSDANLPVEPLRYIIRTLPGRGYLMQGSTRISSVPFTVSGSTAVTFTNDAYSFGAPYTSFTYVANDGKADSAAATVTINVNHINHAPVLQTASNSISATRSQSVPILIVAQDFDAGNTLTATISPVESGKGSLSLDGEAISSQASRSYGNYQAMMFNYTAPDKGSVINTFFTVSIKDQNNLSADIRIDIKVEFDIRPPIPSPIGTVILDERSQIIITIGGKDQDDQAVRLLIDSIPLKGKLYYPAQILASNLVTEGTLLISSNTDEVSANVLYVHEAADPNISNGAESDSFVASIRNAQLTGRVTVNIAVQDKNFAPSISSPKTSQSIPDAQITRTVSFKMAGADPDNDELNAFIVSHTNTNIKLTQGGALINLANPLTKDASGSWVFDVEVPALRVGVIDKIYAVIRDSGSLSSSELELVVETTYVNFAPVTTTTSVATFLEDTFVEFSVSGSDDNNDVLSAYVSGFPSIGVLYDGNGIVINADSGFIPVISGSFKLKYVPPMYTYGDPLSTMRYYVTDGSLRSADRTLSFNVTHVNHAPVLVLVDMVNLLENSFVDILIGLTDVDSLDTFTVKFTAVPETIASFGSQFKFVEGGQIINVGQAYPITRSGLLVRFTPARFRYFTDSFSVEVSDGELTNSNSTLITVVNINHAPVAQSQSATSLEDGSVVVTLTGTDSDIPADILSFEITSLPARGKLFNGDSEIASVPYILPANHSAVFKPTPITFGSPYTSFTFKAFDGIERSEPAPVVIDVIHVNHAPTARTSADRVTMNRYSSGSFTVSGNDVDYIDTVSLRVVIPQSFRGILTSDGAVIANGALFNFNSTTLSKSFEYAGPAESTNTVPDYGNNYASVSFVVVDNTGAESATETVAFDITFVSRQPSGVNEPSSVSVNERESGYVKLTGSDKDDLPLNITIVEVPSVGKLYINGSSTALSVGAVVASGVSAETTLLYASREAPSEFVSTGAESSRFLYEVSNGDKIARYTVNVVIQDKNFAPFIDAATRSHVIPDAQSTRTVSFVLKGIDPDNDELDAFIVRHTDTDIKLMQGGALINLANPLTKDASGSWVFDVEVPALRVGVIDKIYAVVKDSGSLSSSELELVVETTYVNFAPVTTTTSVATFLENSFVEFSVSGSDDNNDVLSAYVSGFPSIGVLYDGNGEEINVTSGFIPVVSGSFKLKYVPPKYRSGNPLTAMRYYVFDGALRSEGYNLNFNVTDVNNSPIAIKSSSEIISHEVPNTPDDTRDIIQEKFVVISGSDYDEGDILSIVLQTLPSPAFGKLMVNNIVIEAIPDAGFPIDSNFSFLPVNYKSGTNVTQFSFHVYDGQEFSESQTIYISIVDINQAPQILVGGLRIKTQENTAKELVIDQLTYFMDPDGDELLLSVTKAPVAGTISGIVKNFSGSESVWSLIYAPRFDLSRLTYGKDFDSIEFTVGDGRKLSNSTLRVAIDVEDKNFAPTGGDIFINTQEVDEVALEFSSKLLDIDGDNVTVIIKTLPAEGLVVINGTSITLADLPFLIPLEKINQAKFLRNEIDLIDTSFTYVAFDGQLESIADYNVSVYILGYINYPPVPIVESDLYTTPENRPITIPLGGFDRNRDLLSAYISSLPTRGNLHQTSNGISIGHKIEAGDMVTLSDQWRVVYVPEPYDATGPFSFSFYLNDTKLISSTATISIAVTDVNYPPSSFSEPGIVRMDEDSEQFITLKGFDQDGDKLRAQLTFEPFSGSLFLAHRNGSMVDSTPIRRPNQLEPFEFPESDNEEWYVVFRPNPNESGNSYGNFFFRVIDEPGLESVEVMVQINVAAVNDAPVIEAPINITSNPNTPVPVRGIVVKEVDRGVNNPKNPYVAELVADIGYISMPNIASATISPEDFASGVSSMNITAPFNVLNNALANLIYTPPIGANGTTTIHIVVHDNGNSGSGESLSAASTILVEILGVEEVTPAEEEDITSAIAGGAVGAAAAVAGAFWVFKKVSAKENYTFQPPEREGDVFASNPLYEANENSGAMRSNPLYEAGDA